MTDDHQMTPGEQVAITILFLIAYLALLPLMALVALYRAIPERRIVIKIKRI